MATTAKQSEAKWAVYRTQRHEALCALQVRTGEMIELTFGKNAWQDHTDRLYSDGVHVDGAAFIYSASAGKKLVTLCCNMAAVDELLSDFDYYADSIECGEFAGDKYMMATATSMKRAAVTIRKQLNNK